MKATALQPFGPDIWLLDGAVIEILGFRYPTRMAVIRLPDDNLLIWSPTALSENVRSQIDSLGVVRHLVAPNSLHHLFLQDWREAYPQAILYAAPGLRERRHDLEIDTELTGQRAAAWSDEVEYVLVRGNRITTEAVFFHRRSRTVLFADLLQQFPRGWFRGWRALVARLDLMTGNEPAVPRKFRAAFTDRSAAREAMRQIIAWPSELVVIAHGAPVRDDGKAFIARAFQWLTG